MNLPKLKSLNKYLLAGVGILLFGTGMVFSNANTYFAQAVIDGDTIIAIRNKEKITIRLIGIDAPEIDHAKYGKTGDCFGNEAKNFLAKEIEGKNIIFLADPVSSKKDKYNRYLGYIFSGQRLENFEMVRNGYAFVYEYEDFLIKKIFYEAQKLARKEKLGLWGKECDYNFKSK